MSSRDEFNLPPELAGQPADTLSALTDGEFNMGLTHLDLIAFKVLGDNKGHWSVALDLVGWQGE